MEIIIILGLGGLTWLADFALEKVLERRLRGFKANNVYFIPSFFRKPLLMVALVLIPLEIIFPLAWLFHQENGIEVGLAIGLPAIMLPLLVFAIFMLWTHFGAVVLMSDSFRRYYLIGYAEIPYREIITIEQRIFFLSPITAIIGSEKKIRFPRQIQNHPQLYMELNDLCKANQQAKGTHTPKNNKPIEFPFSFGISSRRLTWEKIALVSLLLICAGLSVMGLWIQIAQNMLPPFTFESLIIFMIFFFPFGVVIPILVVIVYKQTIHPDQPLQITLHREQIDVLYPHQRQECYEVSDLESVRLNPIRSTLKSSFDGAKVSEQVISYGLVMEFSGGNKLTLTPNRLALFKQTPENLRRVFKDLYQI